MEIQKEMIQISMRIKELEWKERRRALISCRIKQGLKKIAKQPWMLLIFGIIGIGFASARFAFCFLFFGKQTILEEVYTVIADVGLGVLCVFSWLGVVYYTGKPRGAAKIERDVAVALCINKENNHHRPFLMSASQIGTSATEYIFWSKWINLTVWNEHRDAILWALQSSSSEEITAGGKYTVVVRAIANKKLEKLEPPADPLFK